MTRDLTKEQFIKQLDKRGWKLLPYMGYVDCGGVNISRFNAGDNRRTQLAYLIAEKERFDDRQRQRKQEINQ